MIIKEIEAIWWFGWTFLTVLIYTVVFQWIFPVGIIGEVEAMWGPIPQTTLASSTSCFGNVCLYPTRPILRWHDVPLMLNVYTSAFPDWIHWLIYRVTESFEMIRISQIVCATLATMTMTFWLRNHLSRHMLIGFWLLLMTDWNYLFYKKALGNTEILLQVSWMFCILPLLFNWNPNTQRRCMTLGLVVGLWTKITFVLHLLPLTIAVLWMTGRRRELFQTLAIGIIIGLLPGILFIWWTESIVIPIRSHDFWTMQWERIQHALAGQSSNVREQSSNVWLWLFDPLPFFTRAYGVPETIWHGWGRLFGYLLTIGALIRFPIPNAMRWVSILGSQVLVLSLIAQDLHHLVIATPLCWLCVVHILNHTPTQRFRILALSGILLSNTWILLDTTDRINQVQTPTFSESNQTALIELLHRHQVTHLVTMDYEVFGVIEALDASIQVTHAWPSISTERWAALPRILDAPPSSHLMVLKSSMPMIYNLQPSQDRLKATATKYGHQIELIDAMSGVELYQIID